MKTRNSIWLIASSVLLCLISCENYQSPTVTTAEAADITGSTATVGGEVTDDGGADVSDRGVFYGLSQNPETNGTKLQIGSGKGTFKSTITGLSSGTKYFIKAYALNSQGLVYGNETSFTTLSVPLLVFDNYIDIFSCKADGTNLTQLTSGTANDCKPRIDYSKTKIAFISNRTGRWEIFSMNIDGSNILQLTTTGVSGGQSNGGPGGIDWTPDGKLIYIKANKLFKMNADGSGATEIAVAPNYYWSEVRCSPSGNKIIAQEQGSWGYTLKTYLMNIDGSNMTLFLDDLAGVQFLGDFSNDGQRFLYSYDVSGHEESSGQSLDDQLMSKNVYGTDETNLSVNKPSGSNDLFPACSPDGSKIFFVHDKIDQGIMNIWVMNPDGSNRINLLTNSPCYSLDCK